jgi:hypothetical protein
MEDFLHQGIGKGNYLIHDDKMEHHVLRSNPDDFILVLSPDLFGPTSIILRLISQAPFISDGKHSLAA